MIDTINLDWDSISYETMLFRIEKIKLYSAFHEITVFSSPSLDGYHVKIIPFFKLKEKVIFYYRFEFDDDYVRLIKDMLSDKKDIRNVLFDYKIKTKGKITMKFEREELFKYWRDTALTEWLKMETQPKLIKN